MERIKSIVGQKIVIYNNEWKILLLKRSATSNGAWNWDLPGWGILLNESAREGLTREIQEETGIANVEDIVPVHTAAKTYSDGTHVFFVGYTWKIPTSVQVSLSHEHNEYVWVDPRDIDQYKLQAHWSETIKKSQKKYPK